MVFFLIRFLDLGSEEVWIWNLFVCLKVFFLRLEDLRCCVFRYLDYNSYFFSQSKLKYVISVVSENVIGRVVTARRGDRRFGGFLVWGWVGLEEFKQEFVVYLGCFENGGGF